MTHGVQADPELRSAANIVTLGDRIVCALGDPPSPCLSTPQNYAAPGTAATIDYSDEQAEAAGVSDWVQRLLTDGLPAAAIAPREDVKVRAEDIAVLGRTASSVPKATLENAGHAVAVSTHADDWLSSYIARSAWLLDTFRPDSAVSRRRLHRDLLVDATS